MTDTRPPETATPPADAPVIADPVAAASTAGFTPPSARREHWAAVVLPPFAVGALVIGVWYFVSYVVLDDRRRFLLQPPHRVLATGFLDWDNFSEILDGLWSSARVALIGLGISIVLGIGIAVLMSRTKLLERAVFPYMVMLQAIPILVLVPLISFWFGTAQTSRVFVCVLISIFPITLNTLFGLQSADRGMHDLFTLEHASWWTRLRKLMFPAALPAVFAGLRISAGLSVIGAIVGDFFFGRGDTGIGQQISQYANQLDGEELFAAIIMTCLLGVVVFLFFGWLQQRVVGKWYDTRN
ncbi:MAG: ABC transporter permease [Ilumatobacteraceae bacterium]